MSSVWVTSSTAKVFKPNAIALGNFDGIHRGHERVLQPILAASRLDQLDQDASANPPLHATVVTFNPHPREFFSGQKKKLLTPLAEKVQQLERLGVEQLVLLPFDRELATLSPQQFFEAILVEQLQAVQISVGEDFRFGHQRAGTAADLQAIARQFGIQVTITSLQTCANKGDNLRISSSLICQALEQGDIPTANRMLGRPYTLSGIVVEGQKLGRRIGFPTANLHLPADKFLPRYGVYCVGVSLSGEGQLDLSHSTTLEGVMNLGCRPTVGGQTTTVEIHLLDWSGDLYGQTLTISLEQFLRPEQKFPSLEALQAQIAADCHTAREIIRN